MIIGLVRQFVYKHRKSSLTMMFFEKRLKETAFHWCLSSEGLCPVCIWHAISTSIFIKSRPLGQKGTSLIRFCRHQSVRAYLPALRLNHLSKTKIVIFTSVQNIPEFKYQTCDLLPPMRFTPCSSTPLLASLPQFSKERWSSLESPKRTCCVRR